MRNILMFGYMYDWPKLDLGVQMLLEVAKKNLVKGDRITVLKCDGDLPICEFNPFHKKHRCGRCSSWEGAAIDLLQPGVEYLSIGELTKDLPPMPVPALDTVESIRSFYVDNFDAGNAAYSSTVGILREPNPSLTGTNREVLDKLLQACLRTYQATLRAIEQIQPDLAYGYNGRFSATRGFFRACQNQGVTCRLYDVPLHDQPKRLQHYWQTENHMLHDFDRVARLIEAAWDDPTVPLNEKKRSGAQFFETKIVGQSDRFRSYTNTQDPHRLPAAWDETKRNVVIFNTTESEFIGIRDRREERGLYRDQLAGVVAIAEALQDDENIELYLRVHPNLANRGNSQTEGIDALNIPNLTVIPALEPVSTYALAKSASVVITFGSTIGIEATYLGKPSILLAPCYYEDIGGALTPGSHEEVVAMIRDPDLQPADRTAALKYGFYFLEGMEKVKHTHSVKYRVYLNDNDTPVRLPLVMHLRKRLSSSLFRGFRRRICGFRLHVPETLRKKLPPIRKRLMTAVVEAKFPPRWFGIRHFVPRSRHCHRIQKVVEGIYSARLINRLDLKSPEPAQKDDAQLSFLFQHGYVKLQDLGISVDDLAGEAKNLFETVPQCDPNLNTIAIRHPFLLNDTPQRFLCLSLVNSLVQGYLGADATFDRIGLFRIPACSKNVDISGLWHHDRVGRRLKLFVFLHDVDELSRPTLYAAGSHTRRLRINTYRLSRLPEESKGDYDVIPLTGKKGDAVLFDTNGIHRACYEGVDLSRDVMVFEWSSSAKASALSPFDLPIGIMKELFPLSLKREQTLIDTSKLQRNGEYFQYGTREHEADAARHLWIGN